MKTVIAHGGFKRFKTLESYLNIKNPSPKLVKILGYIEALMSLNNIDGETQVALLQSFEEKTKISGDSEVRLSKFSKFLESVGDRENLIDTVKDMGMLSTDELEKQAVETGNWMPYMVRQEVLKKLKDNDAPNLDADQSSD